ncbi:hypothetical protein TeGR_g12084, partial [Tetraparma gracilis]
MSSSTPGAAASRTLLSLYYSSPFADGGFLDQLQAGDDAAADCAAEPEEQRPATDRRAKLGRRALAPPAPPPAAPRPALAAAASQSVGPAPSSARALPPPSPPDPREFHMLDVVRDLRLEAELPAPPEPGLEHADEDDPVLSSLRERLGPPQPIRGAPLPPPFP